MSGLYPDASYCTSDIGRLLFKPKNDWTATLTVSGIIETKGIAGTHNDYVLEFKIAPNELIDLDSRIFHVTTRYRELNKLHAALAKTHKQLYLRGTFPSFPAPKIIGSGDPAVLLERRRCTEVFLNFVLDSEVLRKSCALHEFLDKAKEEVATAMSAEEELYSTIDPEHANDILSPEEITEEHPNNDHSAAASSANCDFVFPEIALGSPTEHVTRKNSSKRIFPKLRIDINSQQRDSNNYLVKAGILISTAKKAEQEREFELAFQCYKNAARSLAEGVLTETDSALRNTVKRKTALYIVRAEELFKTYLSYDGSAINLEGLLSGSLHLQDPNIFAFKSANSALKDYDIVGVLPHVNSSFPVLLMEEKSTGSKSVMKLLEKGTEGNGNVLLPTTVPHMVQLQKFFETENYILLLLDYVPNGRLYDFLANVLLPKSRTNRKRKARKRPENAIPPKSSFSYSGQKVSFSVGFDIERVAAMRDENQSTDDPSTYEVSCAVGEDCIAEISVPTGEFYMPRESEGVHVGCEELPAALSFNKVQEHRPVPQNSTLIAFLTEVRSMLSMKKNWPKRTSLPEILVIHWTAQVVSFLYVMHIQHEEFLGYLTPSDLLLGANGNVLITYYARWYSSEFCNRRTSKYLCPESVRLDWKPSAKSDVYTLGCILFELLTGNPVWIAAPHGISMDAEMPIDSCISLACRDLLSKMLAPEEERWSMEEVRSHPYFSVIDWHLYDNPHNNPRLKPNNQENV